MVKDLGVYMSSDYKWSKNINIMVETTKSMMSWALGVFRDRSVNTMITLYKSLIRCRLEYCCPLWDPTDISNIQKLEDIQRNFTSRIISCQDKSYWDRLSYLKLMSLQRRRERYSIIYMWKIKNEIVPNNLDVEFSDNKRLGPRAVVPKLSRYSHAKAQSLYDNSFAVKGPKLWNILPKYVKEHNTLQAFKISLNKFLDGITDQPPIFGYTTPNNNSILSWQNLYKYTNVQN